MEVQDSSGSNGARETHSIAIVLTWPELRNAEYEVVHRIARAAMNIGLNVSVVDNDGFSLWTSKGAVPGPKWRIDRENCDIAISLHFESPRLFDVFSYTALWNPPEFYEGAGYERTIEQLASHNDVLSCRSDVADVHAANVYQGLGRPIEGPFLRLFHNVPEPYLAPNITAEARLFYVGINWERVNGQKGRHQDLLQRLDEEDLIYIHGPRKFLGVEPWEGFANFRGEIPFDGKSVVRTIHECGICLAFSSEAHQRAGIMSNRLFEGLAAGAVIIANSHPFITRYFDDCVITLDDRLSSDQLTQEIRNIILRIRRDPAEAQARAARGQEILRRMFSLEDCLAELVREHPNRVRRFETQISGETEHEVSVILSYTGQDFSCLSDMIETVNRQRGVRMQVFVLCDAMVRATFGEEIRARLRSDVQLAGIVSGDFYAENPVLDAAAKREAASGPFFRQVLGEIRTPFFCVMEADETWFSDHVATLAHALQAAPEKAFACSGMITEDKDEGDRTIRRLHGLAFGELHNLIGADLPRQVGRFLFRGSLVRDLPSSVFAILDGLEHRLLRLWAVFHGMPQMSNYASYVQRLWQDEAVPTPLFTESQQVRFIRDAVRGNPEWLRLSAMFRPPSGAKDEVDAIETERMYKLSRDGDGLRFLRRGFSAPEEAFTWIDGRSGLLEFELEGSHKPLELVFVAGGRNGGPENARQVCTCLINDEVAGALEVDEGEDEFRVPVPSGTKGRVAVLLRLHHAHPVVDTDGEMVDKRHLGLRVAKFGLFETESESGTQDGRRDDAIRLDHFYGLGEDGEGLRYLSGGFSQPEPDLVWIDGASGTLSFGLAAEHGPLELALVAAGRRSRAGAPQVCQVLINGAAADQFELGEEAGRYRVRMALPEAAGRHDIVVTLRASHADQVISPDGRILDRRHLGICLFSFAVTSTAEDGPALPGTMPSAIAAGAPVRPELRMRARARLGRLARALLARIEGRAG